MLSKHFYTSSKEERIRADRQRGRMVQKVAPGEEIQTEVVWIPAL